MLTQYLCYVSKDGTYYQNFCCGNLDELRAMLQAQLVALAKPVLVPGPKGGYIEKGSRLH